MAIDVITLTGRIGTPPTQRVIRGGTTVTTFRVGSTRRKRDPRTGQWHDDGTSWYSVSAYRKLGEFAAASLRKGDPVIVTGRLKIREWENETAKGIAIDLDADAIGHDLNWGSTVFTKPESPASGPSGERTPDEDWARPGADEAPAADWTATAIPGSGAASGAESEAEAPF